MINYPKTYKKALNQAIIKYSAQHCVSMEILASIIWQESKGYQYAIRREEGFFRRYLIGKSSKRLGGYWPTPEQCNRETELHLRKYSFGVCQIMGQTAREQGFSGDSLLKLCDLDTNVELGARYLAKLINREGSVQRGVARYNGSGKQAERYSKKIFYHAETGKFWDMLT